MVPKAKAATGGGAGPALKLLPPEPPEATPRHLGDGIGDLLAHPSGSSLSIPTVCLGHTAGPGPRHADISGQYILPSLSEELL